MSDFFNALVERLDGPSLAMRPRQPALFETPIGEARLSTAGRAGGDEETLVVEDTEHEASPPSASPEAPSPTPRRRGSTRRATSLSLTTIAAPDVETSPGELPESLPATPAPAPRPAQGRREPPEDRSDPDAVSAPPRARFRETAALEPEASHREASRTGSPMRRPEPDLADTAPGRPTPPWRSVAAPFEAAPPTGHVVASVAQDRPASSHSAETEPASVPRPAPTPPKGLQPLGAPRQPREASEQTIHVTIGRIEIRAAGEARSSRGTPEASPVMSLDDYLRSRAR
jgi:hypothetical protein